jgi:hypothetical protein
VAGPASRRGMSSGFDKANLHPVRAATIRETSKNVSPCQSA